MLLEDNDLVIRASAQWAGTSTSAGGSTTWVCSGAGGEAMRRSGVFGGVLLILVGLLFLGGTLGILPPFTWSLIGPLLLVALGLWVILSAFARPRALASEAFAVTLGGARAARVVVRHGAGRLEVSPGAEPGMLADGSGAGGIVHQRRAPPTPSPPSSNRRPGRHGPAARSTGTSA